jgi:YD repeat-containing protein
MIRGLVLLQLLVLPLFAVAQLRQQRLVRQLGYSSDINVPNSWHLGDSAVFVYSGSRHSRFDYNNMEYLHLPATFGSSYRSITSQINSMVAPNNIDSAIYALAVQFDTLRYFTRRPNTDTLYTYYTDVAQYSADGTCARAYYCDDWDTFSRSFHYLHKQFIGEVDTVWRNGQPYSGIRFIQYDAAGNPVLDSSWRALTFNYDAAGHYTSWNWHGGLLYQYTYDAAGRVLTRKMSEPDSGIANTQFMDSFSYTPGIAGYTLKKTYQIEYPHRAILVQDVSFHINALGQKDTMYSNNPAHAYSEKAWVEYNSLGNPIVKYYEYYPYGKLLQRTRTEYYYEDYQMPDIYRSSPDISLFPNPAFDQLFIRGEGIRSVRIYDMLGQLVLQATATGIQGELDVRVLRPGSYIVKVVTDAQMVTQKMVKR